MSGCTFLRRLPVILPTGHTHSPQEPRRLTLDTAIVGALCFFLRLVLLRDRQCLCFVVSGGEATAERSGGARAVATSRASLSRHSTRSNLYTNVYNATCCRCPYSRFTNGRACFHRLLPDTLQHKRPVALEGQRYNHPTINTGHGSSPTW